MRMAFLSWEYWVPPVLSGLVTVILIVMAIDSKERDQQHQIDRMALKHVETIEKQLTVVHERVKQAQELEGQISVLKEQNTRSIADRDQLKRDSDRSEKDREFLREAIKSLTKSQTRIETWMNATPPPKP